MIIAPAIKKDGVVYSAGGPNPTHVTVIKLMVEEGVALPVTKNATLGFLTHDGKFVNREEGAIIAFDCGQIDQPVVELFSEFILRVDYKVDLRHLPMRFDKYGPIERNHTGVSARAYSGL